MARARAVCGGGAGRAKGWWPLGVVRGVSRAVIAGFLPLRGWRLEHPAAGRGGGSAAGPVRRGLKAPAVGARRGGQLGNGQQVA
ncbi:hypothetical protein GCM10009679_47720 [Saccharothrix algeriensis]|uniref:Uncharacterized protein n=1 Tax=Catellatospora bangladeshensis TaxID=310355 RepID=A0A8J3NLY9_9ACTN|nr:hypothetical protein Cba03nite_59300 [Catellatospora bangladeshensis]